MPQLFEDRTLRQSVSFSKGKIKAAIEDRISRVKSPMHSKKIIVIVHTRVSSEPSKAVHPNSDFVFHTKMKVPNKRVILPTVEVKIDDLKGHMAADSCSTVNVIDEEEFQHLQNASTNTGCPKKKVLQFDSK